jgi:hypothetical protein
MKSHREIADLIPWYLNDTIDVRERERLEAHLAACAACRDDLYVERQVYERMAANVVVEHIAATSFKRFQLKLEGLNESTVTRRRSGEAEPVALINRVMKTKPIMNTRSLSISVAASAVILAVALAVFFVHRQTPVPLPQSYITVTTPSVRAPGEVIRAVFVPTTTLGELQAILVEAQLRIVSGPTEAGVYSLAATTARPVMISLDILRQHTAVRFAESTQMPADLAKP